MTAEQWSNVESLFSELSALSPEERSARLDAVADWDVRCEVASLLDDPTPNLNTVRIFEEEGRKFRFYLTIGGNIADMCVVGKGGSAPPLPKISTKSMP